MKCRIVASLLVVAWCAGCGPGASQGDDEAGTSSGSSGTSSGTMSTTVGSDATTTPSSDDADDDVMSTTTEPADLPVDQPCDAFAQDCPEGLKCMPVSMGSSELNQTLCKPVVPDPNELYDECSLLGEYGEGLDDCDVGQFCWNFDPETLGGGECFGLCAGDPQAPTCADAEANCAISAASALNLCLPTCDPLGNDCDGDEACIYVNDRFGCVPLAGDLGYGEECDSLNVCMAGFLCAASRAFEDCAAAGCCTDFCDVTDPDAATNCAGAPDVRCMPFFEDPPEGLGHVGLCAVP